MRGTVVAVSAWLLLSLFLSFAGGIEVSGYSETNGGWNTPSRAAKLDVDAIPKSDAPPAVSLRVGSILPITGELSAFGPPMSDAANLAADEINAVGILGGSVELLHKDSQTDPTAATDAAIELVSAGVPVIIGAAASNVSVPVTEITVTSQVLQISPASTSPEFTTLEPVEPGWFWRTAASDALQGRVAALRAVERGWTAVGIMVMDVPLWLGVADAFREVFAGDGRSVLVQVNSTSGQVNYTAELQRIANVAPEAVFLVGERGDSRTIMQDWWASRGPPEWNWSWLFWEYLMTSSDFIQDLQSAGIDLTGVEGPLTVLEGPNYATFRTEYLARYGTEPQIFAAHAYDALYLTALAAVASQGTDSVSIRDQLIAVATPLGTVVGPGMKEFERAVCILDAGGNINYEGASGLTNFDAVGDVGSSYEIGQFTPSYEIVPVSSVAESTIWPPSNRTSTDTTSPIVSISSPAPGVPLATSTITVRWSASDQESGLDYFELRLDGGTPVCLPSTASSHILSNVDEGSHTITVTAYDLAGNPQVASVGVALDTTTPQITITAPNDGAILNSTSVTVRGTASDNVAVAKVELSTDEMEWVLAPGDTSWSGTLPLGEGRNTIYARATDPAGNMETRSIDVTVETPRNLAPVLVVAAIVPVQIIVIIIVVQVYRKPGKGSG